MKTISSIQDIISNANVIDRYIKSRKDPEYEFGLNLIKNGTCFVSLKIDGKYRFYPSRFLGYKGNSMDNHINNEFKDGKETNRAINKVQKNKPSHNPMLNREYEDYCNELGLVAREKLPFGNSRKFWLVEKTN